MFSCAEGLKIFAILFENNLVLRISQKSLVKWARAFSQSVSALTATHSGALGPVSTLGRPGFGPRSAN